MKFEDKRKDWQARMESIVIEMMQERTDNGLPLLVSVDPILEAFLRVLSQMEQGRKSETAMLITHDAT
jgi:hypothetical protein